MHQPPSSDAALDEGHLGNVPREGIWPLRPISRWVERVDRRAMGAGLLYALFGIAWILFSDRLLYGLSSDLPVLLAIGQWKGFAFVALSAAMLYAAARRPGRSNMSTVTEITGTGTARLVIVLVLTAVVIVAAGIAGAVNAASQERQEAATEMHAVVSSKVAHWTSWLDDRRSDAEALLRDHELQRLLLQWHKAPQGAVRTSLLARVNELCAQAGCVEARLYETPDMQLLDRGEAHATEPGLSQRIEHALAASRPQFGPVRTAESPGEDRAFLDVIVPLEPPQAATALLRFDARPVIKRMLSDGEDDEESGVQVVMVRDAGKTQYQMESRASGEVSVLQRLADPQAGESVAPHSSEPGVMFSAKDWQGRPVLGVAKVLEDSEWRVLVYMDEDLLNERAWSQILWIAAANLCALILAAMAIVGLHHRRELRAARRQAEDQQEKLNTLRLLESIANGAETLIFAKDLQGRYTLANEAACRAFGLSAEEVIGRDATAFFSSGDHESIANLDRDVLRTGLPFHGEIELTVGGDRRCFFATLGPLRDAEANINGMFGVVQDLTERKQQEERHRQWAMAFESTRDGVMITDAQGRIQSVNRAFSTITGYAPEQAIGQTPALLHSGRHDRAFYRELWQSVKTSGHWRGEIWNRRSNGEVYPEWLTVSEVRNDAGKVANYVGVFTDITRMKRDEAELQQLANFDPLTQLPNRRFLQHRLEQTLAHDKRHGGRAAVLYIDLDGFKTVNDSLGHPAGDELLICIAERLKARVRAEDTLGRLGGDEFLVVVGSLSDARDAAVLAQDLLAAIARPIELSCGQEAYVTASIGISVHPDDGGVSATDVLRDADAAMYRAKAEGRNRFVFYTQDLNVQAVSRLEIEASLSRALERNELLLHYQPKVDAASGRIVGAEALLRWRRNGELIPPGKFIPIAEHSSLILDIGAWVIDQACWQIRDWLDRGVAVPRVAVNVAARQFAAGDLDVVVSAALQRHRVQASLLELELTESMLIEKPEAGIAMLTRLKSTGVKLSLDDFGTGYSNLGYLSQFPIDALKIDKSFIDQIAEGPNGSAIVDAVIALAHRLDLAVVAEGVETEQQRLYLREQGCDQLQGFCISRPLPAAAFEALVREEHACEVA